MLIFNIIVHLLYVEVAGEMLRANLSEVLDVILVSGSQEQGTSVGQVLQVATVEELHHFRHSFEVQVLPIINIGN